MVLAPSPWKPPQMPFTSSVGRAPRRSSGRKSGFAEQLRHADAVRDDRLLERQSAELIVPPLRDGQHLVVEAGHRHRAVLALQGRDDACERDGRVLDVAAPGAGVQVDVRSRDVDLGVQQAPQADRDGRMIALEETGVADDREVRAEAMAVGLQPAVEVGGPGLLLALEHVAHVDGQPPRGLQPRAGGPQVEMDLTLVVRGAAGEDPAILDPRLERRSDPQVERIDRLDVVVAVDQDRRRAVGMQPVGIDDRVARRGGHLDVLESPALQPVGHERRSGDHVGPVLRQRARCSGCAGSRRSRRGARSPCSSRKASMRAMASVMDLPGHDGRPPRRCAAVFRVARQTVRAGP